ncbi:hypothetical protein [Pinirhizobacter soli]|uniref:hypothetical protein n=1 Tax=Pinirhizobacter soli TaxID=2786953 RepID=UPI002029E77C|nr:hypothetical protein [Pinirhizobacter soli]
MCATQDFLMSGRQGWLAFLRKSRPDPKEIVVKAEYKGRPGEVGALMDRLDEMVTIDESQNDIRTSAAIAVDFCDLLFESLDADQRDGLAAAHAWWNDGDVEAHRKFVSVFADVIDQDIKNRTPPREAALNRLVWCALNVNSPFCSYAAEFVTGLGKDAGLTARQMTDVFAKYVPGL